MDLVEHVVVKMRFWSNADQMFDEDCVVIGMNDGLFQPGSKAVLANLRIFLMGLHECEKQH